MTTEELSELFLTALYDLSEAAPHPYFLFSANEFAPSIGLANPRELLAATQLLEEKGLVFCASMDAMGGISAGITPEGAIYVEKGGETGIIERYRRDPMAFRVAQETPAVPSPSKPERVQSEESPPYRAYGQPVEETVEALLSAITAGLWRDPSLPEDARQDLLRDVETLKLQLTKRARNRAVIGAMLDSLSSLPSVAPLIARLAPLAMQ